MAEKWKKSKWRKVGKKRCTTLACEDKDSGDTMQFEICIEGKFKGKGWKRKK